MFARLSTVSRMSALSALSTISSIARGRMRPVIAGGSCPVSERLLFRARFSRLANSGCAAMRRLVADRAHARKRRVTGVREERAHLASLMARPLASVGFGRMTLLEAYLALAVRTGNAWRFSGETRRRVWRDDSRADFAKRSHFGLETV